MTLRSPGAGWYPDPDEPGARRYFDGRAWGPSISSEEAGDSYAERQLELAEEAAVRGERTRRLLVALFCIVVAVASAVPGFWLVTVVASVCCVVALWRAI